MNELADYPIKVFTFPYVSAGVLLQSQANLDFNKSLTTYPSIQIVNEIGIINISSQIQT